MAHNINELRYLLEKKQSEFTLSSPIRFIEHPQSNTYGITDEQIPFIFFKGKSNLLQPGNSIRDFVYMGHLYTQQCGNGNTIFPNFQLATYKSFLPNIARWFCPRPYIYWPFSLYYKDNVFIGNGLILDSQFRVLLALEADFTRSEDNNDYRVHMSNISCKIDRKVILGKSTPFNFIKNTLLPILISNGYPITIDDFSKITLFESVIPPKSFDFEDEVYDTMLNNIDNMKYA